MPPEVTTAPLVAVPVRPLQGGPSGQALQGGRYRLEFRSHGCPGCRFHTLHAFLLLHFLVDEVETQREVSDVVCSRCEPERFARLQRLAPHLA